MDGAYDGSVKFIYCMGENPMVSDPDLNHIEIQQEELFPDIYTLYRVEKKFFHYHSEQKL